jgi:hypothetical protein
MGFTSMAAARDLGDPLSQTDGARALAPQILGIIASHGPVPLQCNGESCRADVSTFCLQQWRDNPLPGQSYVPVARADIMLSAEDEAGHTVRFAPPPHLSFTANRGFTAVEVAIPAEALAKLSLHHPAIEIGQRVSLLPETVANDRTQPTADEIAVASGVILDRGVAFFDNAGRPGDAIRLANQMINTLPAYGHAAGDSDSRVLEAAIASETGRGSSPEGVALVRAMYATCRYKVDVASYYDTMRSCLEAAHDQLVAATSVDFWRSLASWTINRMSVAPNAGTGQNQLR